jgi:glyoxylase-like metal-dependent hydrolase (beta-lactamase superfamily II)
MSQLPASTDHRTEPRKEKRRMTGAASEVAPEEVRLGPVRVLLGERGGRYPDGNSLLIEGERETVVIDPARGLIPRAGALPRIDRVLHSHCHEDHIAGSHLFPDAPWHFHELDLPGITSLDGMMAIYGLDESADAAFRKVLVDQFHYTPRGDALALREGDGFDFGGVQLQVLHTPGHTRGHCCFLVEWREDGAPRRLLFLADIELTSFGPYYGDAWSSLDDFELSIARVREIRADWYVTGHHIGVLEGRAPYLERLERFESMIADRERRLLEFLREPHSLDDVVDHRFVYRKGDDTIFANPVERRSMAQHIERLLAARRLRALDGARYVVA